MERFISVLLEHYGGDLPLWLAPEQVRLVPISDEQLDYLNEVAQALKQEGLRVEIDRRNERMNSKIRLAEHEKIPFVAVAGKKKPKKKLFPSENVMEKSRGMEVSALHHF